MQDNTHPESPQKPSSSRKVSSEEIKNMTLEVTKEGTLSSEIFNISRTTLANSRAIENIWNNLEANSRAIEANKQAIQEVKEIALSNKQTIERLEALMQQLIQKLN